MPRKIPSGRRGPGGKAACGPARGAVYLGTVDSHGCPLPLAGKRRARRLLGASRCCSRRHLLSSRTPHHTGGGWLGGRRGEAGRRAAPALRCARETAPLEEEATGRGRLARSLAFPPPPLFPRACDETAETDRKQRMLKHKREGRETCAHGYTLLCRGEQEKGRGRGAVCVAWPAPF